MRSQDQRLEFVCVLSEVCKAKREALKERDPELVGADSAAVAFKTHT